MTEGGTSLIQKDPCKRTAPKTLQINNVLTYDVENTNGSNKGRDLFLTNKLQIVPCTLISTSSTRGRRDKKSCYSVDWQQKGIWYDPPSWIINYIKMCKISDEVINFIEKNTETCREELTARERSLDEAKIQRGVFQGDFLSPLLFVIAIMPLNYNTTAYLRNAPADSISKSQEKNQSPNVHQTVC